MACFREVPDEDPGDLGSLRFLIIDRETPPDDIRVHPGAAHIFAQFIHDQNIDLFKRKPGHQLPCLLEKDLLLFKHLLRFEELDEGRFVIGIFDDPHSEKDGKFFEDDGAYFRQDGREPMLDREPVNHHGSLGFSHADDHHLDQTTLKLSLEIGVEFDPVDDDDLVRLAGYSYR